MSKPLQLTIQEPCHEKWNKMAPQEKGRFCDSCQKTVVDFTGMTDAQVLAFFKRPATGSVCGRFMNDQLDRDISIPRKRVPWVKYLFQVALPALLISTKASAQGKVRIVEDTVAAPCRPAMVGEITVTPGIEKKAGKMIRSRLVNEDGESVAYASVIVKGENVGAMSDTAGKFELSVPFAKKKIVLEISAIGYETIEKTIDLSGPTRVDKIFVMQMRQTVTMGFVADVVKQKPSKKESHPLITRLIMDSISTRFKIFPNPAASGANLNIELKSMEEGYYQLELSNSNGIRVYQQQVWIDAEARVIDFGIPAVTPGNYLLSLRNKLTNKILTEKLAIQ